MKLIKQPTPWTCAAACVCMVTGTSLEQFYAFCGHDGSEKVEVTAARWMGVRCFDIKEMVRYLLEYDCFLGCGGTTVEANFDPVKTALTLYVDWERQDVLVDVKSGTEGIHQILWSNKLGRLIDPLFPEKQVTFEDYDIVGWWPVVRTHGAMS